MQGTVEVQQKKEVLTNVQNPLIELCVQVFMQGIDLLNRLDDIVFTKIISGKSSIGVHFRHNLDFVTNFLQGIETGKIDYNLRERDEMVETNRQYAISRFDSVIWKLKNLSAEKLDQKILVRSETVENLWCESSVTRELEFLQSHTIHHYALIVEKLSHLNIEIPKDFGVAPSTLEYWKSLCVNAQKTS